MDKMIESFDPCLFGVHAHALIFGYRFGHHTVIMRDDLLEEGQIFAKVVQNILTLFGTGHGYVFGNQTAQTVNISLIG